MLWSRKCQWLSRVLLCHHQSLHLYHQQPVCQWQRSPPTLFQLRLQWSWVCLARTELSLSLAFVKQWWRSWNEPSKSLTSDMLTRLSCVVMINFHEGLFATKPETWQYNTTRMQRIKIIKNVQNSIKHLVIHHGNVAKSVKHDMTSVMLCSTRTNHVKLVVRQSKLIWSAKTDTLSPVHTGDKGRTGNKSATKSTVADTVDFVTDMVDFVAGFGNKLNLTACCGGLFCWYGQLCCWYGRLCLQCVAGFTCNHKWWPGRLIIFILTETEMTLRIRFISFHSVTYTKRRIRAKLMKAN